jgi:hypothetical protein
MLLIATDFFGGDIVDGDRDGLALDNGLVAHACASTLFQVLLSLAMAVT